METRLFGAGEAEKVAQSPFEFAKLWWAKAAVKKRRI